jgi:glycerol-3-phosphate dehydrogenase
LHERGLFLKNAPHLMRALPFVIPIYAWWAAGWYGVGMRVYDLLAGKLGIGGSKLIGYGEAIRTAPTLKRKGLLGGVMYYDGQFDDARMTVSLLRTFLNHQGAALNYMPVTGLVKDSSGRVTGVRVRDAEGGSELEIMSRAVINATGVYADSLRTMDEPQAKRLLSPSQGVHIVLDRSFLPSDNAIMVPRTDDGRVLFVIPWHGRAVVGTTDTPVSEALIEPRPLEEEIHFLLDHASRYLEKAPKRSDVLSTFAGLRPLVKAGKGGAATAALSRDHTLVVSSGGLITITGGKWTTYRKMGEDTINKAIKVADLPQRPSITRTLKLHGWQEQRNDETLGVYGADVSGVEKVMAEQPGWDQLLHPRLPYYTGEVVWAARNEMARTVEDVLARRTRALLLDARASNEAAPKVAALLATELGFDDAWQAEQVRAYHKLAEGYVLS